jgi:hypothetical protein
VTLPAPVSDFRSNPNDQIAHAVRAIGKDKIRAAIFKELHSGKKRIKTATELAVAIKKPRKRVLEEAIKLVHARVIGQARRDGEIFYEREVDYYRLRDKILKLVENPRAFAKLPTKYSPVGATIRFSPVPRQLVKTKTATINDIDNFAKARRVRNATSVANMREEVFKHGVQRIAGEKGRFKDWGGESSDLFTSRLRINGRRVAVAFGFKGRGLKGVLNPSRMGKNGDQVQRLFAEDADAYFVQFGGQIAPSMLQQMAVFAQSKSLTTGRLIRYGIIDGEDSARLVAAYPNAFKNTRK